MTAADQTTESNMDQFRHFKERYPTCVLFFRMGDTYELFHDDAVLIHEMLGAPMERMPDGTPVARVSRDAVENWLRRMIMAGYRCAVCDPVNLVPAAILPH
jgi:DNA mismatch repair protein MutS